MSTQMIRKQIYIQKRQDALLKRLSRARGLSQAEIIRRAIERETSGTTAMPAESDRSAWETLCDFLDARHTAGKDRQPYHWNREDIYAERESRWIRDEEQG